MELNYPLVALFLFSGNLKKLLLKNSPLGFGNRRVTSWGKILQGIKCKRIYDIIYIKN